MEVKKRRKYSKEFIEDVVNILKTGDKSVPELSRELEIAEAVIYRWYKKSQGNQGTGEEKVVDRVNFPQILIQADSLNYNSPNY